MSSEMEWVFREVEAGRLSVKTAVERLRVVHAQVEEPREQLLQPSINGPEEKPAPDLRDRLLKWLTGMFASVTGFSASEVEPDHTYECYGVDSITVLKLNEGLRPGFADLAKTVFFEYPTLGELCDYLLVERPEECARLASTTADLPSIDDNQLQRAALNDVGTITPHHYRQKPAYRSAQAPTVEGIAIIGLSGRYGGAQNIDEYWQLISCGRDAIVEIPEERWSLDGFYEPDVERAVAQGRSYSKWGAFVPGFAEFDARFFGIAPREANNIDPQERMFLQSVYETLEDAGYTKERLAKQECGQVGVFAGITKTGFELYGSLLRQRGERAYPHTSFSSVANRVSYLLDFRGPSMPIDTMCSASLTAIHEACEHLLRGECRLAIAGGVNLYLHPSSYIGLCAQRMLSRSGRCRSFGAGGDGFVPGEGVGTVLLKPLSKAIADRDHIYGVIKSTSINHGGKTAGYTVPNPNAQSELIETALNRARIDARAVSYIEAHGTGTELGDPIEIAGLNKAFARYTNDTQYCAIGSVKGNIGHLEAAAGIAGLTKVLLQMRHGALAPSLHAEELNPHINFASSPFRVQRTLEEWRRPVLTVRGRSEECARISGVSSFGAGGANAHVIITEYREPRRVRVSSPKLNQKRSVLIVLSARNEDRLRERVRQLLCLLRDGSRTGLSLGDIAYTLQVGRSAMAERLGFTAETIEELVAKLTGYLDGKSTESYASRTYYRGSLAGRSGKASLQEEAVSGAISAWREEEESAPLLSLWAAGEAVDWDLIYPIGSRFDVDVPRRVSLPAYPFAKDKYWFDTNASIASEGADHDTSLSNHTSDRFAHSVGLQRLVPIWESAACTSDIKSDSEQAFETSSQKPIVFGAQKSMEDEIRRRYPDARFIGTACDTEVADITGALRALEVFDHVIWIAPLEECRTGVALIDAQRRGVLPLFRVLKSLLAVGAGGKALAFTVITFRTQGVAGRTFDPAHASVHGLVGSVAKEYPLWSIRALDLESTTDLLESRWFCVPSNPRARVWAYRETRWHQMQLVPLAPLPASTTVSGREKIYVVIGGAGHLGSIWSEYALQRDRAQLIWIGRRPLDEAIQAKIDRLSMLGLAPKYVCADAADLSSLELAYSRIKQEFPRIDGVVVSTIVLEPRALREMEENQFLAGLRAKVNVAVHVAQVFGSDTLDYLIFFSSAIALIKNARHSAYAAGCTFSDAFAESLSRCAQIRATRVQVMNFGFWDQRENLDAPAFAELAARGIGALKSAEAFAVLDEFMASPLNRLVLMKTTKPTLLEGTSAKSFITVHSNRASVNCTTQGASCMAEESERIASEHGVERESNAGSAQPIESLLARLMLVQLRTVGLFDGNTAFSDQFHALDPCYRRWFEESERILERERLIENRGDRKVAKLSSDHETLWREWRDVKMHWFESSARAALGELLETALRALPEIITGRKAATDVLFAKTSVGFVGDVYHGNVDVDVYNTRVAKCVTAAIKSRMEEEAAATCAAEPFRLLEIGAGTGGTTRAVLSHLELHAKHIEEYCYTDISSAFLHHGKESFGRHAFVNFKLFNVERGVQEQNFSSGTYDIVIAANVLHATRDIRVAIRNAKALLRRGGLLLLNEMYVKESSLFTHLTFGLTKGWWLFEDPHLRVPGTPALLPSTWQTILESEGFILRSAFGGSSASNGHQVIVAQSDGIVVQPVNSIKARPPNAELRAHENAARQVRSEFGSDSQEQERRFVRMKLATLLSDSLSLDAAEIAAEISFVDYGMDSILGIGFVAKINEYFALDLKSTVIYDHPSVERLTSLLLGSLKERIQWRLEGTYVNSSCVSDSTSTHDEPSLSVGRQQDRLIRCPIAVVGMSGRFAKSENLEVFWNHLANGDDLVEVAQRWPSSQTVHHGSFLDDIDKFDPMFFNISGIEAVYMDPKQRLFLEEAWRALEDAGFAVAKARGSRCGVYVGCEPGDYQSLFAGAPPAQAMWGNASSVLPARIAYHLDLQGPAISVDTACSSSLVAVHLACQALWNDEVNLAIAGGVALRCTPKAQAGLVAAGMTSSSGRCRTFDGRADGFASGEGVGAVVLMRLDDAIKDDANILGVIRGSGINQDGATNGITAPSANSQERLERYVYDTFGINPDHIEMVEAHGTGTPLGDPIEFDALVRAFRKDTARKQYCAIGSVKTNIGHALAASGIAGLLKVLLAIKHKQFPPSLHFESPNPLIDMDASPFYVNTRLRQWEARRSKEGTTLPRMAAVSAFGMSGTNAHLVIESYEPMPSTCAISAEPAHLFTISARTPESLRTRIRDLIAAFADVNSVQEKAMMAACSNTLLNYREHFEYRCAIVGTDINHVRELLSNALCGHTSPGIALGASVRKFVEKPDVRKDADALLADLSTLGHDTQAYRDGLLALGDLYCQGYNFNWTILFRRNVQRRTSLPTYPFAKERYWVNERLEPEARGDRSIAYSALSSPIHSLLHRNVSRLGEQRYATFFTGDEYYLTDHVVASRRVLPGTCYLEMARAAVMDAISGSTALDTNSVILRNIAWLRPIAVDAPREVFLGLRRLRDEQLEFEIFTQSREPAKAGEGLLSIVHAQGCAVVTPSSARTSEREHIDPTALRARCRRSISSQQCYETFSKRNVEYGPAHRGLAGVHIGELDGRKFVLAKIELPIRVRETLSEFVLHPVILDCALQSTVAWLHCESDDLTTNEGIPRAPLLPFSVDRVEVFDQSTVVAWAVIRLDESKSPVAEQAFFGLRNRHRFDVDLHDESGKLIVRIQGLTMRVVANEASILPDSGEAAIESSSGTPELSTFVWEHHDVLQDTIVAGDRHVMMIASSPAQVAELKQCNPSVRFDYLEVRVEQRLDAVFARVGAAVFRRVQEILKAGPKGIKSFQVLVESDASRGEPLLALSALFKSANAENPKFRGQIIVVPRGTAVARLWKILDENARNVGKGDVEICYEDDIRLVHTHKKLDVQDCNVSELPWKNGGIYLITGGMGGLGLHFAREISRRVQHPQLILVGRSLRSAHIESQLAALRRQFDGAQFEYRALNVEDGPAVQTCIQDIVHDYGRLDGILHAAGVVHDAFVIRKTSEEFARTMAPKVHGTVNLSEATLALDLDFLILFGSLSGVLGNVGQSDYATANAFMDRYALHRSSCQTRFRRNGRTLAIDWPLWSNGGMGADANTQERLRSSGVTTLSTEAAFAALYRAWALRLAQVAVIPSSRRSVDTLRLSEGAAADERPSGNSASVTSKQPPEVIFSDDHTLQTRTVEFLRTVLAQALHLPVERVAKNFGLDKLGIDSILALKIVADLEQTFGSLPKSLLFEFPDIEAMAEYFMLEHKQKLISHFTVGELASVTAKVSAPLPHTVRIDRTAKTLPLSESIVHSAAMSDSLRSDLDIAIVGIGGRYPGADNLDQFWENLQSGKDSITEIPLERWDQGLYFDSEKGKVGKSYCKWGGFLSAVDNFDSEFFNILPQEAAIMDPQERLFLECVQTTLEDSGYTSQSLQRRRHTKAKVGVFVGAMYVEYHLHAQAHESHEYSLGGNLASIANRVSYFFDFQGPSLTVDTMCSSSLTAIHLAVQSLRTGGCDAAVAGGVNISIHPSKYVVLSQGGYASSDGRCGSFGAGGDGYVPGEGVGALLLKRLADAIEDGDRIYGVIKGTSINHGGRARGYKIPNPSAQADAVDEAIRDARIHPRMISYVEAHATGTLLGDSMEISGITQAFKRYTADTQFCAIGSVKSNIGHLESAAGVAGLTKVLLQMRHRTLAPSLHTETLNPMIDFAKTPFRVQQRLEEWHRPQTDKLEFAQQSPRIAGVSSFGGGGSNAHVIVEEYIDTHVRRSTSSLTNNVPALVVLSARNEERLEALVRRWILRLDRGEYVDSDLADIAYTLQVGRQPLEHRLAFTAVTLDEFKRKLKSCIDKQTELAIDNKCWRGSCDQDNETILNLNSDEDAVSLITSWIQKRKFGKLLELWVRGLSIDWNDLYRLCPDYQALSPRRISLPTYAFALERYWIGTRGMASERTTSR